MKSRRHFMRRLSGAECCLQTFRLNTISSQRFLSFYDAVYAISFAAFDRHSSGDVATCAATPAAVPAANPPATLTRVLRTQTDGANTAEQPRSDVRKRISSSLSRVIVQAVDTLCAALLVQPSHLDGSRSPNDCSADGQRLRQ